VDWSGFGWDGDGDDKDDRSAERNYRVQQASNNGNRISLFEVCVWLIHGSGKAKARTQRKMWSA